MARAAWRRWLAALLCAAATWLPLPVRGGETSVNVTLCSYNLHIGVPMGKEIGHQVIGTAELDAQAAQVAKSGARIIAMQEVDSDFGYALPPERRRTSMIAMPRYLAARLSFSYIFGSAQDDIRYPSDNPDYLEWGTPKQWQNNGARHGEVGNAILTGFPIVEPPSILSLPRLPEKERRSCIRARLRLSMEGTDPATVPECLVYATHLQHDSAESRRDQMTAILNAIRKDNSDLTTFIMGDFNSSREQLPEADNPVHLALETGFHDLYGDWAMAKGIQPENTFPADKPETRIDFILCNRPLEVENAGVIPGGASDHLPMFVTVRIPNP